MKAKANIPEILVGVFLTIAVFAIGMSFDSSRHQPAQQSTNAQAAQGYQGHKPEPFSIDWLTHDGVVFFTAVLCFIAFVQAGLFLWQLRYMRVGMRDAKIAADAAKLGSQAALEANRAWLNVSEVCFAKPLAVRANGVVADVDIKIENVGRSPALGVTAWVQLIPVPTGGRTIQDAQASVLSEAISRSDYPGNAIFPTQTSVFPISTSIATKELESSSVNVVGRGTLSTILLGVCVCYRSDDSATVRHTCRVYSLGWVLTSPSETAVERLNAGVVNSLWDSAT